MDLIKSAPGYQSVIERVFGQVSEHQAMLMAERASAPRLLAELLGHPTGRRLILLRNSNRFQNWALCELLIDLSRREVFHRPSQGKETAELATQAVDRLSVERYGTSTIQDLKARAWGQLANSLRILHDFRGAEEAFGIAHFCLRSGSMDPVEKARLFDLEASLLREQRRFGESEALLDRALATYRSVGDIGLEARALIKKAGCALNSMDQERLAEAEVCCRRAIELLDPVAEDRLIFIAEHNLIATLAESGKFTEAHSLMSRSAERYERFGDGPSRARRVWLQGLIATGLGSFDRADAALRQARASFLELEQGFSAAVVSLDLALVLFQKGETDQVKQLATEIEPVFAAQNIHREAMAALMLFQKAVMAETVTASLMADLKSYLQRAEHDPALRFAPQG